MSTILLLLCFLVSGSYAFQDLSHYSSVLSKNQNYRIYLPTNYASSGLSYPVIYYFHGNSGAYNSSKVSRYNQSTLQSFLDAKPVVLVCADGRTVTSGGSPYNMGNHQDITNSHQYADYVLELFDYIDANYRTIKTRAGRAIIGFSKGGIISWLCAGKYPERLAVAVNAVGSPEFFFGTPSNHTLYSQRFMFENHGGIHLRFHTSPTEQLYYLNQEVHLAAMREKALGYTNISYPGGHDLPYMAFTEAVDFIMNGLGHPLPQPGRWHHSDLYATFSVWDYLVNSNKNQPGFICLNGVTPGGLGISTKKWMPNGPVIPATTVSVTTGPIYAPNTAYTLFNYRELSGTSSTASVTSNAQGRITISSDNEPRQFGIWGSSAMPEIVVLAHQVNDATQFMPNGASVSMKLKLLNRGGTASGALTVNLSTSAAGVVITNPNIGTGAIAAGTELWTETSFIISSSVAPPGNAAPHAVRFNLAVTDGANTWEDELDVPVRFAAVRYWVTVDDGSGSGVGNRNGIPEPGEKVLLRDRANHPLRLYYDDSAIDFQQERLFDTWLSDIWGGDGITLTSLIRIADNAVNGATIQFLANYETKDYATINRHVYWGNAELTIGQRPGIERQNNTVAQAGADLTVLPGPNGTFYFRVKAARALPFALIVHDFAGKRLWQGHPAQPERRFTWRSNPLASGNYVVSMEYGPLKQSRWIQVCR